MPAEVNVSGLSAVNSFSSPDGLCFSPSTGILWIQTDDGAVTDETNCMLLAAIPGSVGDGKSLLVNIQHPGEKTPALGSAAQYKFQSQWPAKASGAMQYGVGERPRSATIIISRIDGGLIGT